MSAFNHQTKKIQPLLFKLIATTTDMNIMELEHLRLLTMRLAETLDETGGISFSAFGIKITYVNIIQVSNDNLLTAILFETNN